LLVGSERRYGCVFRNGTRIFADAADKRGFFTSLTAKIRYIRVYPRPIHKSERRYGCVFRNGTRIFADAADKRGFFTSLTAKIRYIRVPFINLITPTENWSLNTDCNGQSLTGSGARSDDQAQQV
jgi:hypothetical protein